MGLTVTKLASAKAFAAYQFRQIARLLSRVSRRVEEFAIQTKFQPASEINDF
jgi:hypothetical protein